MERLLLQRWHGDMGDIESNHIQINISSFTADNLIFLYCYQSSSSGVFSCFNNSYFTVMTLWLWNIISRFLDNVILKLGGIYKIAQICGQGYLIFLGKYHACMQLLKNEEGKENLYPQESHFKLGGYYNYEDILLN